MQYNIIIYKLILLSFARVDVHHKSEKKEKVIERRGTWEVRD